MQQRGRVAPFATFDPATIFTRVTGSAQKRRLHLEGANFVECGEDLPESSAFHIVCKQGFPLGVQSDFLDEEPSLSGSSETSEEDSA